MEWVVVLVAVRLVGVRAVLEQQHRCLGPVAPHGVRERCGAVRAVASWRVRIEVLALVEHPSLDCIFWEDGAGCQVYHARPLQCRQWPFWPEMLASKAAWKAEKSICPGMDVEDGRLYSREEIDRIAGSKRGTLRGRKPKKRLPTAD